MKKFFVFLFKTIKIVALICAAIYLNVYSAYYMCTSFEMNRQEILVLNGTLLGTALAIYLLLKNKVKGKWLKLSLFLGIYVLVGFISYGTRDIYAEFFLGGNICR
ncbi:MAG: hypothetical protein LBR70_02200 [Lactobacillaceae bacterium]|jgi:hypothetical protein|nr:hypothetical protein [Lactobacillaceae bacterium]